MIEFAKEHDQKLFEALKDVRCYLQDNLRFEEKTQIDVNFKTQEFFFDFVSLTLVFKGFQSSAKNLVFCGTLKAF